MDSTSIGESFSVASAIEDVLSLTIDKKKHVEIADILNPFIALLATIITFLADSKTFVTC
ncbi:4717_t:CDS:2 [Funneliformis caledonium]|uniref:4717_t:CDS:1 n=1 Tax=Funneliformis caledonium TaxID=1117310 RepID=A0A9N9BQH8_9GLOM|nr:4717_t:CDS:2 [Funneliformis caledonium]